MQSLNIPLTSTTKPVSLVQNFLANLDKENDVHRIITDVSAKPPADPPKQDENTTINTGFNICDSKPASMLHGTSTIPPVGSPPSLVPHSDVIFGNAPQTAVEEAVQHNDTSTIILSSEAPHKLGLTTLTEEWLPAPTQPEQDTTNVASVVSFTEKDFPHTIKPTEDPDIRDRIAEIDVALTQLKMLAQGTIPNDVANDPDTYISNLVSRLPSPDNFQAGGWTPYYEVWRHFLARYRSKRRNVGEVLKAIKCGAKWPLVKPSSQKGMPDHKAKMARVHRMIANQMGQATAHRMLNSDTPQAVEFPNHKSVEAYPDFVDQAITDLLASKAAIKLPDGQRPLIVNPLGVADNKAPKLRLVIDPAYPNLLFKYEPLRYEQLADMTMYVQPGDYATSTDEKSGYYHQILHPSMWTYLGFNWRGSYYVFTHMAFGIGPACRSYTILKQELFRVIRDLGKVRMTFLIDDQCNVASDWMKALFQSSIILRIQWALNFTLSIPKCNFIPTREPHFLGMILDIPNLRFLLPEAKIVDFIALVSDLTRATSITNKLLAKLAGKLISFSPAIGLAPLYAQALYKIMKGHEGWESLYETPQAAIADMQWVAANLASWNGHTWSSNREVLLVAGDYSSTHGYAAYTPNGELKDPIVVSLNNDELRSISNNTLSSTYGEIAVVDLTIDTLLAHAPDLIKGRRLHYEGDNQAAMTVLAGMKGNDVNFSLVRNIWEKAKAADVELSFEWHPRSEGRQQTADAWSKVEDNSQWALNQEVFDSMITNNHLVKAKGGITIDQMADNTNAKAPRYRSRFYCPGTLGVNSFMYNWAVDEATGKRELSYINGDWSRMGDILAKVIRDQADCVIVYPDWPRYWQVMWHEIPVKEVITLARRSDLCIPGPRVPRSKCAGRPPKYPVKAAFVIWH